MSAQTNPRIEALAEEQIEEERYFPVLSQMPKERPEQDTERAKQIREFVLLEKREQLASLTTEDIERARAERREFVSVMVNGRLVDLPLEEAAERVAAATAADRASADDQVRRPVPGLGGQPPKDQRQQ